jgi:exopolysaccharide production protein ExoQ
MSAGTATIAYGVLVLALFLMDRDRESQESWTLWLPVAWLTIGASRALSAWPPVQATGLQADVEAGPLDVVVVTGLLMAGLIVLVSRGPLTGKVLRANGPLLVFFLYCVVSVLWSDDPFVAFKRWTKGLGNLVMVLIVLTHPDPLHAIKRFLARPAFLLLPLSVLLIKYYPQFGQEYGPFGDRYYIGITTGKNGLGAACLIFGLAALWRLLQALRDGDTSNRTGPLVANGVVLLIVLGLFAVIDSATSLACFLAGSGLLLATSVSEIARKPSMVHLFTAVLVFVAVAGVLFGATDVVQTLGRESTLTGRTALWNDVLSMTVDPLFGAGFESFWLGGRLEQIWSRYWWHPNQAHNGYLEVFLNLGWTGVALLAFAMASGYRNVVRSLNRNPDVGGLKLAYFVVALLYNLTEAAFKVMHPVWIAFLLAIAHVPELWGELEQ